MAISYPLAHPGTPAFRRMTWRMESVVSVVESPFTLTQQVQAQQGQRWRVGVTLPPMTRAQAEAWLAWLAALNGPEGTFHLGDPLGATARGVATGTPLVKGAAQTGQTLLTDGWTPTTTGILKAGDWIQLGSGSTQRLYKVLQDADSDGGSNATLEIWPRLRESPGDNDPITVSGCEGLFRLAQAVNEWDENEAAHYGFGFEAVEALPTS